MPDLTTSFFWHCETAENWSTVVVGSKGDKYSVKWSSGSHKNWISVQRDWSCDCMAYATKPGYCKHIKQVIAAKKRCGWMQFTDGGEPDIAGRCPNCGDRIHSMGWAV